MRAIAPTIVETELPIQALFTRNFYVLVSAAIVLGALIAKHMTTATALKSMPPRDLDIERHGRSGQQSIGKGHG